MSGRVMKGFLVFTVVFFFAVVGLVGLTVVMKRHENAQIAEEDKTLVAPDPQKIQRLVDKTDLSDLPESDRASARIGVTALLKACPRIVNLMTEQDEPISVADSYGSPDWYHAGARFNVFVSFKRVAMQKVPNRFKEEGGLAEYGLRGGGNPGALVIWPFDHWLCNVPDDKSYIEVNDAVNKKKIPYKDLMRFIPLKDIPPNSF